MPGLANRVRAQAGASTAGAATSAADSLDDARKRLGKIAGEDSDEGRKARKALDAMDAEGEDDDTEPKHDEPDGDEGEDDSDEDDATAAEDSDDATAAESDDDATAAESDDDASAAESDDDATAAESDDAATAAEDSDDARKAKAKATAASRALKAMRDAQAAADAAGRKARVALRSGAKDAAKQARTHLATQDRCLAQAEKHRGEAAHAKELAEVFASNAKLNARLSKMATAGKVVARKPPVAAANALRGHRAVGTQLAPAPTAAPKAARALPASMVRAAGLSRFTASPIENEGTDEEGLGPVTPEDAAKYHAELQTRLTALSGGRAR